MLKASDARLSFGLAVSVALLSIPLGTATGAAAPLQPAAATVAAASLPSGGSTWIRKAKGRTHLLHVARSGSSVRYLYVPYPWSYCAAGTLRGTRFVGRQHRRTGIDPIVSITRTFRMHGARLRFHGHNWSRTTRKKAFGAAKKSNGPLTATIPDLWARCLWRVL